MHQPDVLGPNNDTDTWALISANINLIQFDTSVNLTFSIPSFLTLKTKIKRKYI